MATNQKTLAIGFLEICYRKSPMRLQILTALSSIFLLNGLAGCAQGYFKGLDSESPIELNVSGYEIWIEKICKTETYCPNSDVSIRTFVELEKEEIWFDPLMAYWPEVHDYTLSHCCPINFRTPDSSS